MISEVKANNRFLVAKYAPDLNRMEPRNIGVFIWVNGAVSARFLPDTQAKFIDDQKTYLRWRTFWHDQIASDSIAPIRGPVVPKGSPAFMDALLATQEGNYIIVEGGEVLADLASAEADSAADFLFDQL